MYFVCQIISFPVSFHQHNQINTLMITRLPLHLSHIIHLSFSFFFFFFVSWKKYDTHTRGVFKLRYWTGTDLLCVITSLFCVRGNFLKHNPEIHGWCLGNAFSECHNCRLALSQTTSERLKIKIVNWSKWQCRKYEWEVTSIFVRLSASPSVSFWRKTQIPFILQVVISSPLTDVSC